MPDNRFSKTSLLRICRLTLATIGFVGGLTGCLSTPPQPNGALASLPTAYDFQILDAELKPVNLSALVQATATADVVFIGEYHRNHASHLLEMQLFAARHQANRQRQTILSMEMFSRDQQPLLDRYLNNEIGEKYLIKEAPAWSNYQSGYRPLVEYAKQHQLPVIAANAVGDVVRCIGRHGEGYVNVLSKEEQQQIAIAPFAAIPDYKQKFVALMGGSQHTSDKRAHNTYLAQITRDNTMAETIAAALKQHPGAQVIHINGNFHSEDHLGTVAALLRLEPTLNVQVVTPLHITEFKQGDVSGRDSFYYLLNPQPREFVDPDYRKQSRKAMFEKSRQKAKACKPLSNDITQAR